MGAPKQYDTPNVKRCETCGKFFGRPNNVRGLAWEKRRFCSRSCIRWTLQWQCVDCGITVMSTKKGLRCQQCRIPYNKNVIKKWNEENRERRNELRQQSAARCIERLREYRQRPDIKAKKNAQAREYRKTAKGQKATKEYRKRQRDDINKGRRIRYAKNKDKARAKSREYARNNAVNLTDGYVKGQLRSHGGLNNDEITPELIIAQRELIRLKRAIKQREGK